MVHSLRLIFYYKDTTFILLDPYGYILRPLHFGFIFTNDLTLTTTKRKNKTTIRRTLILILRLLCFLLMSYNKNFCTRTAQRLYVLNLLFYFAHKTHDGQRTIVSKFVKSSVSLRERRHCSPRDNPGSVRSSRRVGRTSNPWENGHDVTLAPSRRTRVRVLVHQWRLFDESSTYWKSRGSEERSGGVPPLAVTGVGPQPSRTCYPLIRTPKVNTDVGEGEITEGGSS